jgi:hypothetical protein
MCDNIASPSIQPGFVHTPGTNLLPGIRDRVSTGAAQTWRSAPAHAAPIHVHTYASLKVPTAGAEKMVARAPLWLYQASLEKPSLPLTFFDEYTTKRVNAVS